MKSKTKLAPVFTLLVAGCTAWLSCVHADDSRAPEITAQGFRMDVEQQGTLGQFARVRVRIEASERIEVLRIRERSYEVDLASTPDRSHFSLFGLESRPMSRRDVTLNFQNYINTKMDRGGLYEIHIRVIDEEGHAASAVLQINVIAAKTSSMSRHVTDVPVEVSDFAYRRIGAGSVTGTPGLGITWKTVESNEVVIQLTPDPADKLVQLASADFEKIETRTQLHARVTGVEGVVQMRLPAANDKASGRVFAIVGRDGVYVLKVQKSETRLSRLGTTVTLDGSYKH